MEPFQKTKRPLILHQKIMGNPNMKSIDDKKVVQSPCRREKKGKDFFGGKPAGDSRGKKVSPEKKPGGHTRGTASEEGILKKTRKIPLIIYSNVKKGANIDLLHPLNHPVLMYFPLSQRNISIFIVSAGSNGFVSSNSDIS